MARTVSTNSQYQYPYIKNVFFFFFFCQIDYYALGMYLGRGWGALVADSWMTFITSDLDSIVR